MARKFEQPYHDDSWLKSVQDVITVKPQTISFFINRTQDGSQYEYFYDNGKEKIKVNDMHPNNKRAIAFFEVFEQIIDDKLQSNITLKVERTNVHFLFNEIVNKEGIKAERINNLLKRKNIKLIVKNRGE